MKSLQLINRLVVYIQSFWIQEENLKPSQIDNLHQFTIYFPLNFGLFLQGEDQECSVFKRTIEGFIGVDFDIGVWNLMSLFSIYSVLLLTIIIIYKSTIFLYNTVFSKGNMIKNEDNRLRQRAPFTTPLHVVWRYWKSSLLLVLLFSSFIFEFYRLYQAEVSKRAAISLQGIPEGCSTHSKSLLQGSFWWLQWHFSWQRDPCEKYFYALMVDPLWEVGPLMVFSSMITRCIIKPVEIISQSLGLSLRLIFSEIPSPWQPFIMAFIVLFVFIIIFVGAGYRLSVPFILAIEPRAKVKKL